MSCIVGIAEKGKVYMAADSMISCESLYSITLDSKLFRKGQFLISAEGKLRFQDILKYNFVIPEFNEETDLKEYLIRFFVPELAKTVREFGWGDSIIDWRSERFLIGYKAELFTVYGDFNVERNIYQAIGSGEEIALGNLHATRGMKPKKRLRMAMEAAASMITTVKEPFDYLTT